MAVKYLAGERIIGTAAERAGITATYWHEQTAQNNSLVMSVDHQWRWNNLTHKNVSGSSQSMNKLVVYLSKDGTPTSTLRGAIYAADQTSNDSQAPLATSTNSIVGTSLAADANGSYTEYEFDFVTYTVPANGFVGVYVDETENEGNWIKVAVKQDPAPCSSWGIGGTSANPATQFQEYSSACITCKVGLDYNLSVPNGAIYEESDTGKHYMWDGTSAWNEIL